MAIFDGYFFLMAAFLFLWMIRKTFTWILLLILPSLAFGQVINTATMDTVGTTVIGRVGIGGYVDSYYGYNFSKPANGTNPYFVSSARHNEVTINLAYVDVRYRSTYMRARFVPGFGTYMDSNYKNEPGSLKNMVEANVGVLISEKKKIWIDIGVLGSPYTNESAISKDHLMYTRSFAPENVPYYVTGARLSVPVSRKLNAYFYVLNGWQVIQDNNSGKSIATQLEYRPNNNMLFNWTTYLGDERSSKRLISACGISTTFTGFTSQLENFQLLRAFILVINKRMEPPPLLGGRRISLVTMHLTPWSPSLEELNTSMTLALYIQQPLRACQAFVLRA